VVLFKKQANTVDSNNKKIAEFMQLYKPVQHRLSAYCRVVTGREEKALDLIQETLAAAFENFDNLREPGSFQFFLFAIARNCHLKQNRRLKFFGKQSDIKPANIAVVPDTIEMLYDIELIHKSISRLNGEQREAILMFHIIGFSIVDIAQQLSITEAAVKNRLVRGRDNLRKLLSDKESNMINTIFANNFNTTTK
jgi:RNA polymerase sigma factor (sigma-70 family)